MLRGILLDGYDHLLLGFHVIFLYIIDLGLKSKVISL